MNIVFEHFPDLSETQKQKFHQLKNIYDYWNSRINVISRKDFHNFYEHHVLHSLAIAKYVSFTSGTQICDVGTGGGFPGIPLAIAFPHCQFHLVDSIGKKVKVVKDVCHQLDLSHAQAIHARVETLNEKYDFAVSRAVSALPKLIDWTRKLIKKEQQNAVRNGLLYLKGGDFRDELNEVKQKTQVIELSSEFKAPFFETKKLVHVEF